LEPVEDDAGLRERKKAATRLALHEAALRLAVADGLDHVTVEAIADAAGVSRRTFSNYFSSKEEALFHGDADWLRRLLAHLGGRPADEPPWTALGRAVEALLAESGEGPDPRWVARRRQLRSHPGLLAHQVGAYATREAELAAALAPRLTGADAELRAHVLAASFLTVLRVATHHWLEHPDARLVDVVRTALAMAAPS
jgi:AcrR family transcriptional regulator